MEAEVILEKESKGKRQKKKKEKQDEKKPRENKVREPKEDLGEGACELPDSLIVWRITFS